MAQLYEFLNNPHHVAKFQRFFGVYPIDEVKKVEKSNCAGKEDQNGHSPSKQKKNIFEFTENTYELKSRSVNKQNGSSNGVKKAETQHEDDLQPYEEKYPFFHYLFRFGTAMGNEEFYITFFPIMFWNVDGYVARNIYWILELYMYLGQASKDIIRWPRPPSPPVVRIDDRYGLEYGMPSTHAMIGSGVPLTLLYISQFRYQYPVWIGIFLAVAWISLVCCSRLYLGMHTLLDLVAGIGMICTILPPYFMVMETVDDFILSHWLSPYLCILIPLAMCLFYPSMDKWSTARGDTTIILSVGAGVGLGNWVLYTYGICGSSTLSEPYEVVLPTLTSFSYSILRFLVGVLVLVLIRFVMKALMYNGLCYVMGFSKDDGTSLRHLAVELPYKFVTYTVVAFSCVVMPLLYRELGIERETFYFER